MASSSWIHRGVLIFLPHPLVVFMRRCRYDTTEHANIKIQRTGAAISLVDSQLPPAADLERSKDVTCLMGASKAVLRGRSQEATVG
jgi:hypothetical protein